VSTTAVLATVTPAKRAAAAMETKAAAMEAAAMEAAATEAAATAKALQWMVSSATEAAKAGQDAAVVAAVGACPSAPGAAAR